LSDRVGNGTGQNLDRPDKQVSDEIPRCGVGVPLSGGRIGVRPGPPIGVARYEIVAIIDHPGSIYLSAMHLNDRGDVVRTCHPILANKQAGNGFRLRDGACELVNYPDAMNTVLSGTNSAGDIVGRAWFSGQPQAVYFIYKRDRFAVIEVLVDEGPVAAGVWDINDTGMISGHMRTADGREVGFLARPIR